MDPSVVVDVFRQAVALAAMMVFVVVLPGLIVGLLVAMFQAATQINEMSMSFVPKMMVTFAALGVTGTWLLSSILEYSKNLYSDIPLLIG